MLDALDNFLFFIATILLIYISVPYSVKIRERYSIFRFHDGKKHIFVISIIFFYSGAYFFQWCLNSFNTKFLNSQQSVGHLRPANEPDPSYPASVKIFNKQIPKDAMKIFWGGNLCYAEDLKNLVVIRLDGRDILILNKDSEGLTISMAKIFREEDDIEIASIKNNKWESNPNIYFKFLINDPHIGTRRLY